MKEVLKLKTSNCKNCYKCIRHCPVKSICFSGDQAHIVSDECILCGQCFVVCPQNAKQVVDSVEEVKVLLYGREPVFASVAPSFAANWKGTGIAAIEAALKKLGFFAAEETAIGATLVKKEYEKIIATHSRNILISSCCNSVNLLIQKYFPSCLKYLADVVSPMRAHCADIKRRYPGAKTVFIGPCVSKKEEGDRYPEVDSVLTFEELSQWFEEEGIEVEQEIDDNKESRARFFPISGGILKTFETFDKDYDYMVVDGAERCVKALKDIQDGQLDNCFIEMSICKSSCVGGPIMEKLHRAPIRAYQSVTKYAGTEDFVVTELPESQIRNTYDEITVKEIMPNSVEIETILKQMGKTKPEHELNCGSCGYDTCREKAIAVYQGKADLTMCLPFLKDKAESFSDNIVFNIPNGLIVLNENLEVQKINRAALKIVNLRNPSDILGEPIVRVLDPTDFMKVKSSGNALRDNKVYLAEYKKYVEETIIYNKEYHQLLCIMKDISEQEEAREKKEEIKQNTMEVTDKIIEKQMRVVQEIASLLGETTAETKIALTKLKESLKDE